MRPKALRPSAYGAINEAGTTSFLVDVGLDPVRKHGRQIEPFARFGIPLDGCVGIATPRQPETHELPEVAASMIRRGVVLQSYISRMTNSRQNAFVRALVKFNDAIGEGLGLYPAGLKERIDRERIFRSDCAKLGSPFPTIRDAKITTPIHRIITERNARPFGYCCREGANTAHQSLRGLRPFHVPHAVNWLTEGSVLAIVFSISAANDHAALRIDRSEEHTSELQSHHDLVC